MPHFSYFSLHRQYSHWGGRQVCPPQHLLLSNVTSAVATTYLLKCTLVQALRLCTCRTAHRGSRGIALPFHEHGTRRVWEVSVTPRPLFTPGKTRYPLYRRLGGPQGRSGQVRKISPPTGIRSPDRPTRSQWLYRLRYPAHTCL